MQTERQREAAEFRGEGSQKAAEIKAKADRDVTVIVADANSQSEIIRGQGDGEANGIFAQAYGQDPGFFAFYRSMTAYEQSMQRNNTNLVLGPDFDFFRYFGDPSGRRPVQAGGPPPAGSAGCSCWRSRIRPCAGAPGCARRAAGELALRIAGRFPRRVSRRQHVGFSCRAWPVLRDRGYMPCGISRLPPNAPWRAYSATPDTPLRVAGVVSALVGVVIVWRWCAQLQIRLGVEPGRFSAPIRSLMAGLTVFYRCVPRVAGAFNRS